MKASEGKQPNYRHLSYSRLKFFVFIIAWYGFSTINVAYSKQIMQPFLHRDKTELLVTILFSQYLIAAFPNLFWGVISPKSLTSSQFSFERNEVLAGLFYILGNLGALISLAFTSISLNQIIKALEPLFSALLAAVIFKKYLTSHQFVSMLVAVSGACVCAFKDLQFNWFAVSMACLSNFSIAARNVTLKLSKENRKSAFQQQSEISRCAALILLPFWVFLVSGSLDSRSILLIPGVWRLLPMIIISHAVYNFCSISVLSVVENVVEHALLNIMKRPFTIFTISAFDWKNFENPISRILGISILIFGQTAFKLNWKFSMPSVIGKKRSVLSRIVLVSAMSAAAHLYYSSLLHYQSFNIRNHLFFPVLVQLKASKLNFGQVKTLQAPVFLKSNKMINTLKTIISLLLHICYTKSYNQLVIYIFFHILTRRKNTLENMYFKKYV